MSPTSSTVAARVIHNRELIIPYAMSDYASTFATISLDEVLAAMVRRESIGLPGEPLNLATPRRGALFR